MKEELTKAIKSWYYRDKAFGWAMDEEEFIEDLVNHILKELNNV
jgi:hypothetical protein